jgi:hypothetical protein
MLCQQRDSRRVVQPAEPQFGEARAKKWRRFLIPHREDDRNPLRVEPPGREYQGVGRGPVDCSAALPYSMLST